MHLSQSIYSSFSPRSYAHNYHFTLLNPAQPEDRLFNGTHTMDRPSKCSITIQCWCPRKPCAMGSPVWLHSMES